MLQASSSQMHLNSRKFSFLYHLLLILALSNSVQANSLFKNGTGARSMGTGGTSLTLDEDAFSAMYSNPAALTDHKSKSLDIAITSVFLDAEFRNATTVTNGSKAETGPGIIPDLAFIMPLKHHLSAGVSLGLLSALAADYAFVDPSGNTATTTSTGYQTHKSSFITGRLGLGLAYAINSHWSVGASMGLLYNRNRLKAPYIFQSHPVLAGALGGSKVIVNLDAEAYGINGQLSTRYRINDDLMLGIAWTSSTSFEAEGTLRGRTTGVLAGIGGFKYDAEVETNLPQSLSVGLGWNINRDWHLGLQFDWLDWSNAFAELPIRLTNGTNAMLNAAIGDNRIDDTAPLDWQDQYVTRIGVEYRWSERLHFRSGYSYSNNPVPDETLTPLTAAIMQHSISLGLGYRGNSFQAELAWQWDLPTEESVSVSRLRAGEYNSSEVEVGIHWVSLSLSFDYLKAGH